MDQLLKNFGLDIRLFLAQVVNFFILLGALTWLAYKPLTKMLQQRSKRIQDGLDYASSAEQKLKTVEGDVQQLLINARQEAQQIVQKSRQDATVLQAQALETVKMEAANIREKTKLEMEAERKAMMQDMRKEVAGLVVSATEKITYGVLREKVDVILSEQAIRDIEKTKNV